LAPAPSIKVFIYRNSNNDSNKKKTFKTLGASVRCHARYQSIIQIMALPTVHFLAAWYTHWRHYMTHRMTFSPEKSGFAQTHMFKNPHKNI
jgi:hypothetical protein